MNNTDYLKEKKVSVETTTYHELLAVLESYGENRWWISENPRTRAYYQSLDQSSPLILPYRQYISDLTLLLGREVHVNEIRMSNRTELRQEVEQAWERSQAVEDGNVHAH